MSTSAPNRFIVFFVEEESMEAFLNAWFENSRSISVDYHIVVIKGKQGLLKSIGKRVSAYTSNRSYDFRFVVIVDRDGTNCKSLNEKISLACQKVRVETRPKVNWTCASCIVIQELESWYFADWEAVKSEFPRVSSTLTKGAKYRDSERISDASEEFFRYLERKGYRISGRKTYAADLIGKKIDVNRSSSDSFKHLHKVILELEG